MLGANLEQCDQSRLIRLVPAYALIDWIILASLLYLNGSFLLIFPIDIYPQVLVMRSSSCNHQLP